MLSGAARWQRAAFAFSTAITGRWDQCYKIATISCIIVLVVAVELLVRRVELGSTAIADELFPTRR